VLDFAHLELSDSEQALLGMNFVSESSSELSTSAGHFSVVEFKKFFEVKEDSLSGLRPEVSLHVAGWPNLTSKHEVESLGF